MEISVCQVLVFFTDKMWTLEIILVLNGLMQITVMEKSSVAISENKKFVANIGSCVVEIDEPCSSGKILFYVYRTDLENSLGFMALDPKLPLYFNKSRETKILIHGYIGDVNSKDSIFLREVFLKQNEFNLVVVDWGQLTKLPCYPAAVFNVWQVGKCTAIFLKNFIIDKNFSKVHVIGFSLGAHAAAFTSNQLKQRLNKQLGRITGLDPALPFFASLEIIMKLDKQDADFVDLIHTNIGVFGKIEPAGHVDFYVNGGFSQPACQNAPNIPICSHFMAVIYYAESVIDKNKGFWGIPCSNYFEYLIGWCFNICKNNRILMGERCDHSMKLCWVLSFFGIQIIEASDRFPNDFLIGFATSSYQIEGAWNEDGKGENIWDRLVHTQQSKVQDRLNGDIACDSYHKFKDDVEILKYLGADIYRFSLSWSRILPRGDISKINEPGIRYYNYLINELLEKNIQPMVTLYHWDLPQSLQDLGGWTNPIMVDYFEDYAKLAFQAFGDRVKWWITFNEPLEICHTGYGGESSAPCLNMSGVADYLCAHTLLKSHARAYHSYNMDFKKTQNGKVGITLNGGWNEPLTDNEKDKEAAKTSLEFEIGWFLHPISKGDYPLVMRRRIDANSKAENRRRSRLPYFSNYWKTYIKGTMDFLGINHYSTYLQTPSKFEIPAPSFERDLNVSTSQNLSWPGSTVSWLRVEPKGFRRKLNWLKNYTNNFPIFITENGYAGYGELIDEKRISYHWLYLKELLKAIYEDDCAVLGYIAWSLIDNFEWLSGYTAKFGIYRVDFDSSDRRRTPKASSAFFKKLLKTRTLPAYQKNYKKAKREGLL